MVKHAVIAPSVFRRAALALACLMPMTGCAANGFLARNYTCPDHHGMVPGAHICPAFADPLPVPVLDPANFEIVEYAGIVETPPDPEPPAPTVETTVSSLRPPGTAVECAPVYESAPIQIIVPEATPAPNPTPIRAEKSLMEDMLGGMRAIHPEEFDKPIPLVPMAMKQVAASVLRGNRGIQVAAYKPEQARADIMSAKSVYDPEVFGSWAHSRTEAPPAMSIGGQSNPNTKYRNDIGRAGIRQHTPTGATLSAYREWNSGSEYIPGAGAERGHGGAYVAELSQPILNGFADAENRAVIHISRLQADISDEEFRLTVMEIMAKAMEAYWNAALTREDVRINRDSLAMAERLLQRELGRKDEGISTQLDVNRAREAVSTRAYNVHMAQEQQQQAQENLKYFLNDKSVPIGMDIHVDVTESLETPLVRANLDESINTALEYRPEVHNAELAIKTAEIRRRYARHTLLPELNLVGSVRRNDSNSSTPTASSSTLNTGTDWSLGMEFSMPIGNMKARANKRKAESEVSQMIEDKKNVRDMVITEVRTVVKNLDLVVREIPLNKRAMEAALKVLEGEWARLELNQVGNRDLLQAQDLVAVTERNYINSLIRYNVYIVRLFAAEGVLLEKMGISLRQ